MATQSGELYPIADVQNFTGDLREAGDEEEVENRSSVCLLALGRCYYHPTCPAFLTPTLGLAMHRSSSTGCRILTWSPPTLMALVEPTTGAYRAATAHSVSPEVRHTIQNDYVLIIPPFIISQ